MKVRPISYAVGKKCQKDWAAEEGGGNALARPPSTAGLALRGPTSQAGQWSCFGVGIFFLVGQSRTYSDGSLGSRVRGPVFCLGELRSSFLWVDIVGYSGIGDEARGAGRVAPWETPRDGAVTGRRGRLPHGGWPAAPAMMSLWPSLPVNLAGDPGHPLSRVGNIFK